MTVYVDDMYLYPIGQFGRMKMSHMIGDSDHELHAMARRIGIARRWYQGDHYDVAMTKRALGDQPRRGADRISHLRADVRQPQGDGRARREAAGA